MRVDARRVERDARVTADVCIVGGGAAGIAIARELDGGPLSVCLLESGGFGPEAETQALYEGTSAGPLLAPGDDYLTRTRLRFFGGSTNHWQGWCRPLDAIDFEERPWVPHSGWPLGRSDLDACYERAAELVGIRPPDDADVERLAGPEGRLAPDSPRLATRLFRFSPPTHFGRAYRRALVRSGNVALYTHANAVELRSDAAASRVEAVRVACLAGSRFEVRARTFVLAAGGVENARLLLASDRPAAGGLGNRHDRVGRFFADHPTLDAGRLLLARGARELAFYNFHVPRTGGIDHRVLGVLTLSERALRAERLMNLRVYLRPLPPPSAGADGGALAAPLGPGAGRIDGRSGGEAPGHFALDVSCETAPNPDSRVTLARDVDALGMRRARLDWSPTDRDRASLERALRLLAAELGRFGEGRARVVLDPEAPWREARGANHHMGTTRMAADPRRGVVDADCRVHDVANLFVAGSSVFPTCGYANPTLTLLALALRLADHLRAAGP